MGEKRRERKEKIENTKQRRGRKINKKTTGVNVVEASKSRR